MTRYRVVLILDALALLYFGLAFMISPHGMTATFGITLAGTDAVADVCAVYGGYELGIGAFLAYCAMSVDRLRLGLICGSFALSGFFLGRVVGIVSDGHPTTPTFQLLSIDLLGMVLNTGALLMYLRAVKKTA
jgi:hypothetical protein